MINTLRIQQQRLYSPLHPSFAPYPLSTLPSSLTFLQSELPPNIELMTLMMLNIGSEYWSSEGESGVVLLRLSHAFAVDESNEWSKEVSIDLSKLFIQSINNVTRVSLTANSPYRDSRGRGGQVNGSMVFVIYPMEIATFTLRLSDM